MLCPKCNIDRGPDTKYCKDCGTKTVPPGKRCKSNKDDGTLCDSVIEEDASFCSECGNKVETENVCSQCNFQLNSEDTYCPRCGPSTTVTRNGVSTDAVADTSVPKAQSKENISKDESTSDESDSEFVDAVEEIDNAEDTVQADESKIINDAENDTYIDEKPDEQTTDSNMPIQSESEDKPDDKHEERIETPSETAGPSGVLNTCVETDVDSFNQTTIETVIASDTVYVHFHALIPPDVKFQSETDTVQLNIWRKHKDGTKQDEIKKAMEFVETHSDANNATEMKAQIVLEKSEMENSTILYKYFVKRNSEKTNATKREDFWELFFIGGKECEYRRLPARLLLQAFLETNGHFHIYDGFVYKPQRLQSLNNAGIIQTMINTVGFGSRKPYLENCKDAETVIKVFAKQIVSTWSKTISASNMVAIMTHMCNELLISTRNRYIHGKDANIIQQQINQNMWKAFSDFYQSIQDSRSKENRTRKLCILIVMLRLRKAVMQNDNQSLQFLASKLSVEVDINSKRVYEWDILQHNFSKIERANMWNELYLLAKDIVSDVTKNPWWWNLLPFLHFLSGTCEPFEKMQKDAAHAARIPLWWGLKKAELEQLKECYKYKQEGKISIVPIIRKMKDVFLADYYLPRTIVACLQLHEIKELLDAEEIDIPIEVFFAAMAFFVDTCKNKDMISMCLNRLLYHGQKQDHGACKTRLWMKTIIAGDMAVKAIHAHERIIHHIESCTKLYLLSIANYDNEIRNAADEEQMKCNENSLENISFLVIKLARNSTFNNMEAEIDFWDRMICPSYVQSDRVQDVWNGQITSALHEHIKHLIAETPRLRQVFVTLHCKHINFYQPPLQDVLKTFVTEILKDPKSLETTISGGDTEVLRMLMLDTFREQWNEVAKRYRAMNLLVFCQWRNLPFFLTVLCQHDCQDSPEVQNLKSVIAEIERCADMLMSGCVEIRDIKVVSQYKTEFMNLLGFTKYKDNTGIGTAVSIRTQEFGALMRIQGELEQIREFCSTLTLDMTFLETILNSSLDDCRLSDIIVTTPDSAFDKFVGTEVQLKLFPISNEIYKFIKSIEKYGSSNYFKTAWEEECHKHKDNKRFTLEKVYHEVVVPVLDSLEALAETINTGSITFQKIEKSVGYLYEKNYDKMQAELLTICSESGAVDTDFLVSQLKNYRKLELMKDVALTLLDIRNVYELTGDFDLIEQISKASVGEYQISQSISSLVDLCPDLENVTKKQTDCLKAFVTCPDLVAWLREAMKESTPKERRVFVDIATATAGDNVDQASRVQSFEAAVLAYSSLIFDLDRSGDFRHLLRMCQNVWKEQENIEGLSTKLRHVNAHLPWFQHIKKTHGAVEMTSLLQAEVINDYGKYTIGKGDLQNTMARDIDMESVLMLRIPPSQDGTREKREYKFSELQDLQSRLLLVGGEKEQNKLSIDRFTTIFDGAIRLCKIYIELVSSGCVLFKDFTIQVYCNPRPDRPVCVVLEFQDGADVTQLKCHKSEEELVENIMPMVAAAMETCLSQWLDYVKTSRTKHVHLNFFTTDQLVILQREIAKFDTDDCLSDIVFPILQILKRHCTIADIERALDRANEDVREEDRTADDSVEGVPSSDARKDISLKNIFIQKLSHAKQKDMILLALDHFKDDYDNYSKAIAWCVQNKSRKAELEAALAKQQAEAMPEQISSETIKTSSFIADSNIIVCDQMLAKLELKWNKFIQSVSSNIRDFISLTHLGIFLRQLTENETENLSRKFPPNYEETVPNLIVCPAHNVLQTTLSLYMTEENQPLPQADEILMCTSQTTVDEVDIFLRRAIFSSNGKIHCLVYADLLRYTECEGVNKVLTEHLRNRDKSVCFRLVIVCTSENEHTSSIVSTLDGYRREPVKLKIERVSEYIAEHLKVYDTKAAACTDFERSTVRVIRSKRSGMGKTLYKIRKEEQLQNSLNVKTPLSVTLTLHGKDIDIDSIVRRLLPHTRRPGTPDPRIIHIDVSNEVYARQGLDYLLFNLLILGSISDSTGYVWRKNPLDLYLIERLTPENYDNMSDYTCQVLKMLPSSKCLSPRESIEMYTQQRKKGDSSDDQLFDQKLFEGEEYQMPFNYLRQLNRGVIRINTKSKAANPSKREVLETLLKHCQIKDPSWSELYYFVHFLHIQLIDFQNNIFVSPELASELPGFSIFVLKFLIQMSKDFSSRSLSISEETEKATEDEDLCLTAYQMKRTWESSPHPYIFFNSDGTTFTFLGFYIDPNTFDLIDQQTNTVLEEHVMSENLHEALLNNGVPIEENFDQLDRMEKMERICRVMDMPLPETDPDETYELTADNAKKIIAIYMRFRCNIPVIVMGETGCGKTRLVKFMCDLMQTRKDGTPNMIIMRVHGGTTEDDIKQKVREAEKIAICNTEKYNEEKENVNSSTNSIYTVLFFDEANTTESIGLIKEIMCDKTMDGEPLTLCENLKFVAACNPYRRHPKRLIEKLEEAGLGYHVHANETTDRLGRIAMRRLVYRVQPLPPSLLPFVWDFGQLSENVEKLYIRQMVKRYVRQNALPDDQQLVDVITTILGRSQEYMRRVEDECSFVSLRDVERVLQVMCWFLSLSQNNSVWFDLLNKKLGEKYGSKTEFEEKKLDSISRSLVLALGVCYHACLSKKDLYRKFISQYFREPCSLPLGSDQIMDELDSCQEVILDKVTLEKNIARNQALKENIFMMVVCIELRIPLFLVGKPGSSKSLAKVIVTDAMQGNASTEPLFKELKQVQMLSFQCSPISTPQGIVSTFRSCAMFQRGKKLSNFVSAVVLDEIGLAEDSPRMPLKTLHPLLEVGCEGDDIPADERKVAFIGISNWALDPAKMNRGIFVQREIPDSKELEITAKGICSTSMKIPKIHSDLIKPLATAYLEVFDMAVKSKAKREFFGLRDFYCLMKTVNGFIEKYERLPTYSELMFAVLRNFSGLEFDEFVEETISEVFMKKIRYAKQQFRVDDQNYDLPILIESCLKDPSSRHLLLLTENYNALATFQQKILKTSIQYTIIFGSSFHRDQEYTQVCRNISRVKLCMETGKTVILLNSENLYESLYDALNQYYVQLGGQKFVDLGLGSHRVKCRVHKDFKLIIVAEKQLVYDMFPIPLINRLEKHILTSNTMLSNEQNDVAERIKAWAQKFAQATLSLRNRGTEKDIGKVFIGYHEDACSAIVVDISDDTTEQISKVQVIQRAKEKLLWCATPDAVVRLSTTTLYDSTHLQETYWQNQAHDGIMQYLEYQLKTTKCKKLFTQVTTHGRLLVSNHKYLLSEVTGIPSERILLLESLTAFDTEQQFNNKIRKYLELSNGETTLLIVQCENGDANVNLIACARNSVLDEYEKHKRKLYHVMNHDEYEKQKEFLHADVHVLFIIQMPTTTSGNFKSIQCGDWHSAHIDHLVSARKIMPSVVEMQGKSVARLMQEAVETIFGEKDVVEEETKEKPKNVINLREILSECVHGSMSRVKDTGETGYRTTQRITLLLKLLQEDTSNDSKSFLKEISVKLTKILQDKDRISHAPASNNWIAKKAASLDNIVKTGTLRLACLQTFKSMILPILSGIVAFLDTNQNLNILQNEVSSWQYKAWLSILEEDGAISLSYTDMFPDGDMESQRNFVVNGTGVKGLSFPSLMPFSWLIREKIDEIIRCRPEHYDHTEDGSHYDSWAIFEEAPVGKALKCILQTNLDDMIDCYIHDYLHMVYPFEKETELHVLAEYLKQELNVQVEGRPINLMDVHITYTKVENKLKYFRDVNHVWEQCSNVLSESKATIQSIQSRDITIQALYLMVADISTNTRKRCKLHTADGRRAWLDSVHRCRHVVQQTLGFLFTVTNVTEPDSNLLRIRSMWNRVVLLQLFLEDVCTGNDVDSITVDISDALWEMLSEDDDMKNIETISKLDTFLEACYSSAQSEYNEKAEKCSNCESVLHHQKKILPCGHSVCMRCLEEELLSQDARKCLTCKAQLPDGWENIEDASEKQGVDKLQDYKRRCNTFYMNVVSQLCFSENQAPSDDVVDKLMDYPFQRTGLESNEIPTGVDPDDAFKAFILKLLIRTSERKLHEQLEKHFHAMQISLSENDQELLHCQRTNLVFLVVCCLEDTFMEKEQFKSETDLEIARTRLFECQRLLAEQQSVVDKVYGIANARIALAIVAKYIYLIVTKHDSLNEEDTEIKEMLTEAENLCRLYWPWKYLVQQIYKRYGMDILLMACRTENTAISWIYKESEMKSLTGRVDMYLCCGDQYVEVGQNVHNLINGEETSALQRQMSPYTKLLVELALHREFTIPMQRDESSWSDEDIQRLKECECLQDEEFSQLLIANDLKGHPFEMFPDESEHHTTLKCLIFHWYRVLNTICIPTIPSVLKPLLCLAKEPERFNAAFLPTMPQDDMADLREMLINTPVEYEDYFGEVPTLYECPNGHPYQVRDCGKPMYVAKCLCGEPIGGEDHELREDNRPDSGIDRTSYGHILGDANAREDGPFPERTLSRLYCACVRFILHLTMSASCSTNCKATANLIKPAVSERDVSSFLMKHLCKDLEDMQTVLSCNTDDVMLLMHYLADKIMKFDNEDTNESDDEQDDDTIPWGTKQGRQQWETSFSKRILEPVLEESQSILESTNALFQGTNYLVQMLSSSNTSQHEETSVENIDQDGKFWTFRTPITLKHFQQTFERSISSDGSQEEHPLLCAFLENMPVLQAVRFIPSVLRLHRSLFRKYRHKLYRKEAAQITIRKLRTDHLADQDTDKLLDDTINAWNIIRKHLKNHVCNTEYGRVVVPKEITDVQITEDSTICVLLPTTEDEGICTYAMLDMLIKHQNDLLDIYARIYGRDSNTKVRIPSVLPNDLTSAHLVSFDPQTDIQPMILANSTWHLDDGTVEYNFCGFERQLVDRFISTKSRITFNKSLQIQQMIYRTDMKDADSLKRLERVVPQEKMDGRKIAQICSDVNTVPALCQMLSVLDIAISFLNVTSGDPAVYLNDYLVKTLKMEKIDLTLKIKQSCQLKHIQSLWMYMSMKKSRLMVEGGNMSEAVFDIVPKEFHIPIPDEMQHVFERFLYGLKDEALSELLDIMFRYIILRLTKKEKESDSPDEAKYPLKHCLTGITDTTVDEGFPDDLLAEHTVLSWFSVVKVVGERKI